MTQAFKSSVKDLRHLIKKDQIVSRERVVSKQVY